MMDARAAPDDGGAGSLGRRFAMTRLARARYLLGSFVTLFALVAVTHPTLGDELPALRVCLVSGSAEYKSDETLPILEEFLERKYKVECSRAFATSVDNLPGLEALDSCDVMVLFTRRLELEGEQLERIKKYCQSGKPVVGVRTASHAIQSWLDLDREVLGGNYKGHYANEWKTTVEIVRGAEDSPLLRGFKPFVSDGSLYLNTGLAENCQVLMTGTIPEHTEPITWTREHNEGRVFYTSLGHPHDFRHESFLQLLANGVHWAARRQPAVMVARALPRPTEGDARQLEVLDGRVDVYFDQQDVPHIYAGSWNDAARALGYVHASERLWEMDMLRRRASGTLAEILGPGVLESDTFMRQLGLRRSAQAFLLASLRRGGQRAHRRIGKNGLAGLLQDARLRARRVDAGRYARLLEVHGLGPVGHRQRPLVRHDGRETRPRGGRAVVAPRPAL
jgi:type 1 glutamine amidotransferase